MSSEKRGLPRDRRAEHRVEKLLASGKEFGLPQDPVAERAVAQFERQLTPTRAPQPPVERSIGGLALDDDAPAGGVRVSLQARILGRDDQEERRRGEDRGMGW